MKNTLRKVRHFLCSSVARRFPDLHRRLHECVLVGNETNDPTSADKGSTPASATAPKPELKPAVEQQIEALQNRIDELQSAL